MKKITVACALVLTFGMFSIASASDSFNTSLYYGGPNLASEVTKLQSYLVSQGYLHVAPTGLYFSLTKQAVADFQKANGIVPPNGYFGPITRGVVNQKLLAVSTTPDSSGAVISDLSVSTNSSSDSAAVALSSSKTIRWQTSNYPAGAGVTINLIRKVSDSPQSFAFVRTLVTDTPNDGFETWISKSGENTNDLYIEVACSNTFKYSGGCKLSSSPTKIN